MKKIAKNIISFLCVVILFIFIGKVLRYMLVDDTTSYTRLMMHQLYNSDKNIDIAFVGSSHSYQSLIPEITDQGFGAYTFNCGTSTQELDGSLALIKELISHNDIDTIYLELYYFLAYFPSYQNRAQLTSTYVISDYMKPSFRKWSYMLQAGSSKHWVNSFILARREWEKCGDPAYIKELLAKKRSDSYKNYEWTERHEEKSGNYVDRGYVAYQFTCEDIEWIQSGNNPIKTDAISKDWKKSLQKIIETCKKNDVNLVLFMTPLPEWSVAGKINYDAYSQYVRELAEENGVGFCDFNLVKNEYFPTREATYYKDWHHLNYTGAKAFSQFFCDVFTDKYNGETPFYHSFAEKQQDEPPYVYGASALTSDEGSRVRTSRIISNRASGLEYKIIARPDSGPERLLQDYSANTAIELPLEEQGTLCIMWRLSGDDKENTLELKY